MFVGNPSPTDRHAFLQKWIVFDSLLNNNALFTEQQCTFDNQSIGDKSTTERNGCTEKLCLREWNSKLTLGSLIFKQFLVVTYLLE